MLLFNGQNAKEIMPILMVSALIYFIHRFSMIEKVIFVPIDNTKTHL